MGKGRRAVVALIVVCGGLGVIADAPPAHASVAERPFTETACEDLTDSVARLYTAGLGRLPEQGGFEFWLEGYWKAEWTLPRMAHYFVNSPEFQASYGDLDDEGFVRQLYRNVLGREGERDGVAYWVDALERGMDRSVVLLRFAESPENIERSGTVEPALGPFNNGLNRDAMFRCGPTFPESMLVTEADLIASELPERPGLVDWHQLPDYGLPYSASPFSPCSGGTMVSTGFYPVRAERTWVQTEAGASIDESGRWFTERYIVFPTAGLADEFLDRIVIDVEFCGIDERGRGAETAEVATFGDRHLRMVSYGTGGPFRVSDYVRRDNVLVLTDAREGYGGKDAGGITAAEAAAWTALVQGRYEAPSIPDPFFGRTCATPDFIAPEAAWTVCDIVANDEPNTFHFWEAMNRADERFQLELVPVVYPPWERPTTTFRRLYGRSAEPWMFTGILAAEPIETADGYRWEGSLGCGEWALEIDRDGLWTALYPTTPLPAGCFEA